MKYVLGIYWMVTVVFYDSSFLAYLLQQYLIIVYLKGSSLKYIIVTQWFKIICSDEGLLQCEGLSALHMYSV